MITADIAADEAYYLILYRGWEPVGWEIAKQFGVSSATASSIKRILKQRFAAEGVVWGYVPSLNRFVMAAQGQSDIQREIIEYGLEHASTAATSVRYQIRGAEACANITPESASVANDSIRKAEGVLMGATKLLAWVEDESQSNYGLVGGAVEV